MINLDKDLDKILKLGKDQKEYIQSYFDIIDCARSRGLTKPSGEYYEIHHIVPRSKGGGDSNDNLVLLSMPEHIVCHILLFLAYPEDKSLARAAGMMAGVCRGDFEFTMFSGGRIIEEIRDLVLRASSHTWEIKIVCLDAEENIIRIYNSLTEANKLDGFSVSKLSAVLSGARKTTGGHYWKKYSDVCKDSQDKIDEYLRNLDDGILPELNIPNKKVVCCDLEGNIVSIYETIKSAEELDGFDSRQISAVLVGKQKTSREHHWYRYNDYPDKKRLKEFESSTKKPSPIPVKMNYSIVRFNKDLSSVREYCSLRSAAEDIGVERRHLRVSTKDRIREFDGYIYMKLNDFRELYTLAEWVKK